MGAAFSAFFRKLFKKLEVRIVMVGLDESGKSSILSKIKGVNAVPVPTVGYNYDKVVIDKTTFCVWDVGGQEKIRGLWPHYYKGSKAMIFVVDSADHRRITCGHPETNCNQCAACELRKLLNSPDLAESTFLIFANKQDLPGALHVEQIHSALGLPNDPRRKIHIQPCSALTSEGLAAGFTWLSDNLPPGASE
ncbi:putative ADP-ribosylation factor 1 [Paratrimastix pyriformis]|uniref:ADP-ribosylation factor 1 n=1 Tax=Paratrimastix pyriformis TaxID=342808 RepID=A0ABQ8UJ82_9EUKA|nr:putative ADP-ribosylation factor 1 [Paratrimastix pyriformis]QXF29081.1 Arf1b [Paratrimastix pyriformis]|eukprot:GAFH01003786.1.p2 GENE.GAFH01003786.1~~GAFH01003786.1.p2  ORF type:complete len:193 (+),score=8.97 GAFH01003786.1:59-637(+)